MKAIFPFIYILLGEFEAELDSSADIEELLDSDTLEAMLVVMMTILLVFNGRMVELIRVWRQHGMSISQQIESFCGGVFQTWYEKVSMVAFES